MLALESGYKTCGFCFKTYFHYNLLYYEMMKIWIGLDNVLAHVHPELDIWGHFPRNSRKKV